MELLGPIAFLAGLFERNQTYIQNTFVFATILQEVFRKLISLKKN